MKIKNCNQDYYHCRRNKIFDSCIGVVIDPWALGEIEEIKKLGVNTLKNFMISESASIILPFHQEMDEIRENASKGKSELPEEELGHVTKIRLEEGL